MATHWRFKIEERGTAEVPTIILEEAPRTGIDETIVSRLDAHLQAMINHFDLTASESDDPTTDIQVAQCSMKREEVERRGEHFANAYKTSLAGRTNDLASVTVGDVVTFRGDEYRVIAVDVDPSGYETRLHMGDKFGRER